MAMPERYHPWQTDAATELLEQMPEATTLALDFGRGKVGRVVRVSDAESAGRPWRAKGSGRHVTTEFVASFPWRVVPQRVAP